MTGRPSHRNPPNDRRQAPTQLRVSQERESGVLSSFVGEAPGGDCTACSPMRSTFSLYSGSPVSSSATTRTYAAATDGTGTTFQQATAAASMSVYLFGGGAYNQAAMSSAGTIDNPAAGQWTAADIAGLGANAKYNVVFVANGTDGNTYCAALKDATTPP